MLDAEGFTINQNLTEHGRTINISSYGKGLAATINPETLLLSNTDSSKHTEGGETQMAHKRLVNAQEPDQNQHGGKLNGAKIKNITSCSTVNTRGIFKAAESVQINALITFQTNWPAGTDDTTKGFKRRISVMKHRVKFVKPEDIEKDPSVKNLKYYYEPLL